MKRARYMDLLLLPLLLIMFASCEFREVLDDYFVSEVNIKLNWSGVTEKLPETVRVIFYPKDKKGQRFEAYLPAVGGEVEVSPGHYAVVIYNYNTESVLICGDESYETIEAYTGRCPEMITAEGMNWSPDAFYIVALDDIEIEKSDIPIEMEFKPENAVRHYSFEIKIGGLKNVADVICDVKGLDGSFFIGMNNPRTSSLPIYVEIQKGNDTLKGTFSSFVMTKREYSLPVVTRIDTEVIMTLKLVKVDNSIQKVEVNITKVVASPTPGGDVEKPETPGGDVEIEIPLEEEIIVDDVEPVPGGGIGGDVGDWGEEDNVELPV